MRIRVGRHHNPDAYYIGRGSLLGNPFVMRNKSDEERNRVCDDYERWIFEQLNINNLDIINELKHIKNLAHRPEGVTLGCFCSPKRCHGDTIKYIIEHVELGD